MKRRSVRMWSGFAVMAALVAGPLASPAPAQTSPTAPAPTTPPADKPRPAEAAAPVNESVATCLGCHEDKDLSLTLKDGSSMNLYVDAQQFSRSVHGTQLVCTDCHAKYDQNHPSGATFPSRRAYTIAAYETCKKCHFDSYTRTLESVHYELLKAGMEAAPVCTDCHGSHNIQNPHEKRAMLSRSCATCHEDIYKKYAASVHGKALVEGGNKDVPACADCHTHHQIQQPGTTQFRLNSPELCIRCHGDGQLMARYGISARVAQTYLADFHGVTASLERAAPAAQRAIEPGSGPMNLVPVGRSVPSGAAAEVSRPRPRAATAHSSRPTPIEAYVDNGRLGRRSNTRSTPSIAITTTRRNGTRNTPPPTATTPFPTSLATFPTVFATFLTARLTDALDALARLDDGQWLARVEDPEMRHKFSRAPSTGEKIAWAFEALVEPMLPKDRACFVVDFPLEISPLARKRDSEPRLVDRFEAFAARHWHNPVRAAVNDKRRDREAAQYRLDARLLVQCDRGEARGRRVAIQRVGKISLGDGRIPRQVRAVEGVPEPGLRRDPTQDFRECSLPGRYRGLDGGRRQYEEVRLRPVGQNVAECDEPTERVAVHDDGPTACARPDGRTPRCSIAFAAYSRSLGCLDPG